MNALGQCVMRLFYISVFKLLFTQKYKHIKNHHVEYPTLCLMTLSCVLPLNYAISLWAFFVLLFKTCPTLCERLKHLGELAAPPNYAWEGI